MCRVVNEDLKRMLSQNLAGFLQTIARNVEAPEDNMGYEVVGPVVGVTCMVRRPNARRIGLDEKQSAKMYPASREEWFPGA